MERPHGGGCKDEILDIKQEKGTIGGVGPSCGSSTGPPTILGSESEQKMEVDKSLLPTLASLPSTSSVTITKASASALQKSSQNSASSPPISSSSSLSFSSSSSAVSAVSTLTSVTLSTVSGSNPSTPAPEAVPTLSKVGPEMMPTIPLVPVQVPNGRGSVVTLPKNRGRSKGMPLCPSRSGFQTRKGIKIKRLGIRGRGGRRLVHSMSLEERGDDSPLPLDDEAYAQDDMFFAPLYQDKWPGKMCGLCCLSEQSQLGQGELIRHDPTPGYVLPDKIPSPMETEDDSPLSKKFKPSISLYKDKGKSPRKQVGEALPEPVDEISLVGHQEPPTVPMLFESSGHCYVHYMCALWSSDVELSSDDTISCIDRAVVAGASQRCIHCKKFGATIPCKVPGCTRFYHYPCAMSVGAPMDLKSVALVCSAHADKSKDLLVDMACMVCENPAPEGTLLFCSSCGNHYHGSCLKPSITPSASVRAGWQCPDCKMCQMCRQPSDEIVCGVCDKAYHVVCARPFGLSLSRTGWKCKTCRVCGDCGSRTPGNGLSSRWHSNFTVCDSCYQLRNKGLACPICGKAYRAIAQKNMAQCSSCRKHVHNACDSDADIGLIQAKWNSDRSYEYMCATCKKTPGPNQSPLISQDDSCDGPQESSVYSEDSNDLDLSLDSKSEEYTPLPKPHTSFYTRGKPFSLAKRGNFTPRLRGGAVGKKAFSSSKKRGQTMPVRRGRGNGRGYRGYFNYQSVTLQAMENNQSTGKEEGEENKVILVASNDEFCLEQDVCAMCGAFGQDQEGRLISCAQCGQCYHPFCANVKVRLDVKVNKVVLEKGWRCLDCTVCEGCGERNDESRLVLCEDCDISYHIYCMTPPLDSVPSGVWRCKWCAVCQYCGASDPGPSSTWQQNYSVCGPCNSMTQCPVCDEPYADGELVIQCSNCDRWLHASDDMIHTEEEAERCAEKGYLCLMCRPQDALPPHLLPHTPPLRSRPTHSAVTPSATMPSPVRPPSPIDIMPKVTSKAQFWVDGICLSECGMFQIKTMTLEPQKKPRNPKTVRTSRGPSIDSSGSRDIDDDDDDDEEKLESEEPKHWVYGMKEGTILKAKEDGTPPDLPDGFYTLPGPEPGTFTLRKRRYRNIKTLGIGGFQVRARGKKEDEKAREEANLDPQVLELRRKRSNWRTKKKIKLLEKFPSYIQEAFFGRNLMDTSNLEEEMRQIGDLDEEVTEDVFEMQKTKSAISLSKDEVQLVQAAQNKQQMGHERRSESSAQHARLLSPHRIKTDDQTDSKSKEKKEDDKKESKDEDMAEDDENNEAIDAIFAQGGDLTDILMSDIMSAAMKDDDTNLTGDEDLSQDNIDVPGVGGPETKLTDILGPGFNLDDVADIMKNLPEDSTEDSQDSTVSSAAPSTSTKESTEANSTPAARNEGSTAVKEPAAAATTTAQTATTVTVPKETPRTTPVPETPVTLPAASTLRPNQPPVAPLGSVSSVPPHTVGPPVQPMTVSGVPMPSAVPGTNAVPPMKNTAPLPSPALSTPALPTPSLPTPALPTPAIPTPALQTPALQTPALQTPAHPTPSLPTPVLQTTALPTPALPAPVALASSHQNPPALPSPLPHQTPVHPSPITGGPTPIPQSLPSPLPRTESQSSPAGYQPPQQANFPTTQKASTPTVPEPQKMWSSNDSLSQSLTLEEDEALGHKATKAAVLYVNIHKPNLKNDYPSVPDRERQIKRTWKNLKDTEQKKMLIQRARENKKEYYKNKQEQQRAMKSTESVEGSSTPGSVGTPGSLTEGNNTDPSPGSTPHASPRPPLPSITPPRPMIVPQRPQMPPGSPTMRPTMTHTIVRGPMSHPQPPQDPYAMQPGTPHPNKQPDPYGHPPSTPRPQISPLPSPTSDSYSRVPPSPRPHTTDPYSVPPSTPRPPTSDPYAMPPPTPRPMDPYASQPATPRTPITSDPFTTQPDSFSQPSSGYIQAPPTPRPHSDDSYGQPPTPVSIPSDPGGQQQQQHLRELLQRQRPQQWSEGNVVHQPGVPQPMSSPNGSHTEFRQPLPPVVPGQGVRMRPSLAGNQPGMMVHAAVPGQAGQVDSRFRMIIHRNLQQQQQPQPQQQQPPPPQGGHNSLDPFNHLVQQRPHQQYMNVGSNVVRGPPTTVMVSQGMGSPHITAAGPVPVAVASPTHHPQGPPHPLGPAPHPQPPHPQQPHPPQPHGPQPHHPPGHPQAHPPLQQQPHPQLPHPQPHAQAHPPQPPGANQGESELPEAVTRELEQLEEEQQQQQQHHHHQPAPANQQPASQPSGQGQGHGGDDLEDLGTGDLTTMEDDLLGMGGDFNALLEFADGEDGEEDDEKLPSNLFNDLDADEEERRKRNKSDEVGGAAKEKVSLSTSIPVGPPGAQPHPSVSASQGPQPHLRNPGGGPRAQVPVAGNPQQRLAAIIEAGRSAQASVQPNMSTTGTASVTAGPSDCSNMPTPPNMVPIGPSSGPPAGPPPGPIMGPMHMSSMGQSQQPVQPQMATHITQPSPRFPGMAAGISRMPGPRGAMIRQPAPPPPPYPGHPPPPPYPRSQPLLIEDLLEQEKQEQMKQQKANQQQQQESLGQDDLNLSDMEFEKLKADVLSVGNPSVGLNSIAGGQVIGNNAVRQPFQRVVGQPPAQGVGQPMYQSPGPAQPMTRPVRPQADPGMHPALLQAVGSRGTVPSSPGTVIIRTLPPPPQPPDNPQTEAERQQQLQYENWLAQQQCLINQQQSHYDAEIAKLRKQRKSLNSRQRTLRKNGQELSEHDAAELARVQRDASNIQRHLEQCRKSSRQHAMIMQEYNNKKRQRQTHIMNTPSGVIGSGAPGQMMSGASPMGPTGSSPMHSTPQSPLMSPSPSSQPGMGLSPMVPSPHTPAASPNPVIVPQHSPHAMVVPVPHPSPGEPPFSPQTRMPSPGGGYPDQGPRVPYPGPQGMNHHMNMMGPQMRVRMPVHSPGTQTVQPGQMSPHMMGVRPAYPQSGVMMPQGQAPMMMRHQYPQGVMPLRRPSGSGPVPSPGSGPSPSPGGPVPSPIGSGMAMKPSPVHSGLKSPVPLASPSPGGPVPSPLSGTMAMKPSPVHSGLRSPVPLASPQMRPHSAENPSTPLTPRSVGAGDIGPPHTPHSDMGGASGSNSQVNSPHPSVPTPTSDAVPSPVPASTPSSVVPSGQRGGGGGGGNANNPNNPAPCPPYMRRFGYFKLGLRGGGFVKSRWGHIKLGLKGGMPHGDVENSSVQVTSNNELTSTLPTTTTTIAHSVSEPTTVRAGGAPVASLKTEPESDEGQEGLAHVLSESGPVKGPIVRMSMIGGGSQRGNQSAYVSAGSSVTMTPQLSANANKVLVPEPLKSEIPPSSRHQAVIGIPGGGAIFSQNNMYPTHTVAPGIRLPSAVSTVNYPSTVSNQPQPPASIAGVLSSSSGSIPAVSGTLVPPPIMSVTSSAESRLTSNQAISQSSEEVLTLSNVMSINNQVSSITSGLTNFATTASLPLNSSATTNTTPSLSRPLVSVPLQQIGVQQRPVLQTLTTTVPTQQVRTLPSIGNLQSGTRQFKTLIRASVAQHPGLIQAGSQDPSGNQIVTQHQVLQHAIPQQVGMINTGAQPTVGQQSWVQTTGGPIPQGGVVVQGGAPQTVGVRMVQQPMMVQRGGSVMVRPGTAGQVAVQGGVRMMMIQGQPVRTPSPPVNRPAMMPPPAAKSPAGHSASPIPRVSPAPSPLSNHPSPHSPQVKGQSPLMNSPAPSPHGPHTLPVGMIKREPDDEHPNTTAPHPNVPVGHVTISGVQQQAAPNLHIAIPQHGTQPVSTIAGTIKTEVGSEGLNKDSSNALLKQLLENTSCANSQPSSSSLVLFRSPQGPVPVPSSNLTHIASQIPNPTPIVVSRSGVPGQPLSHSTVLQAGGTTTALIPQSVNMQQQSQQQHTAGPGPLPQHLGPNPQMRSVVVSSGPHPPQGHVTHTVVMGQQHQVIAHSDGHGNLTHTVVRPGVPYSAQHHMVDPHGAGPQPSSQHIGVRQVSTHHISHPGLNSPAAGHHVIQGAPTHQTVTVSHPSHPMGHPLPHANPQMVVHPGMRPAHPGQHPVVNAHPPGTHIVTGQRPPLATAVLNATPTPASMADRVNNNPALKTEMRVMIPETVLGTGTSTGEHTPEMTTPNEGSDPLDHEEKKARKRSQQARRKSQSKDTKVQPAKRARQGSRVEEDYDAYIDNVMQQLRSMPPLTIMEPEVPKNFNLCPMFGSGDLSNLGRRDYNHRQGVLEGKEGHLTVKNITDYYSTQPFGDKPPMVTPAKTNPAPRGFYIHEFTPPKIGLPLDEYPEGDTVVTTSNRPTPAQTPTRDADSPDTVLSSSSPECILPESPLPFKGLRLVDMDEDHQEDQRDRSLSPAIPLLVPTPIRPGQLPFMPHVKKDSKDIPELDKENIGSLASITMKSRLGQSPALPLKDMGNVSVTLTLSSQAGEDVSGILRSLANLLNIPPPSSYQMADRIEPPKLQRLYRHKHPKDGVEQLVDIQSILNGQARFCKHCDMIILKDILCKKVSELPFLNKSDYESVDELSFCSQQCYVQFAISHRVVVEDNMKIEGSNRFKLKDASGNDTKGSSILSDEALLDWSKEEGMDEVLKVPQLEDSLHSRPNKHKLEEDQEQYPRQADGKRFRGHKYKYWTPNALILPEKYEKPTPKEMTDLLFRMGITYRKPKIKDDTRQCILCSLYGDYVADGPSRLLNFDVDKWVHLNCALWADEVYETMNGALMNVEASLKKVSNYVCEHCQQSGASVKCFKVRCSKVYHLNCAVKEGCTFYKNKTVFCQEHINKGEKDNELSTLAVFRRVFVDRDDNRQVASVMHHADLSYVLRIGSLILIAIGQLFPHQLQAFHTPYCIYPVGYQVIRYYWSMRRLHKRCAYECSIHDNSGQPEFRITVKEEGFEDHTFISCSPKGVWNKVLEPLAELRQKADVVRLFPQYINGEDLFGLTEPAIVRILESLPGIDTLADYNFKYGRNPLFELPLAVNPTGCARSEPFNKMHLKRYHGMRTSVGSVRNSSNCRNAASVANLTMTFDPYSKLHVHSRSSQYKRMRNEWRSAVYLARSKIQGLGLYAARDIEKNTMIIEYIGEIIRSELAEVREKRYESQNRGIYMFRLDDQRVVDATVTGGLARYVNHSCGPNCYTETIEVERDLKILIISNRKILRGEELAYDYKFDEEEDHKIPCLCGADNCRKWMN